MAALNAIHAKLNQEVAQAGGRIDAIFLCPHGPDDGCTCRKPLPGMCRDIARRYDAELERRAGHRRFAARPAGRRRARAARPGWRSPATARSTRGKGGLPEGTRLCADMAEFADILIKDHFKD